MIIGDRVKERMSALRLTQAELARRVGLKQPTIYGLIHRNKIGSKHIHRIARELGTTPAYLEGEIDDPAQDAPPPPPVPTAQVVQMGVVLPAQAALARMFLGIIEASPRMSKVELANELAKHLPTGLALLRGPLTFEDQPDDLDAADAQAEDQHDDRPVRRRA